MPRMIAPTRIERDLPSPHAETSIIADEILQPMRRPPLEFRVPDGDTLPRFVCAELRRRSTTRTRRSSSAACPSGRTGAAVQARDRAAPTGCGRCRRAFSRTARRSSPARSARRSRRRHARVDIGELYTLISLPQINQVYMVFRARLAGPRLRSRRRRASRCACSTRPRSRGSGSRSARSAARCATGSSIASWARFPLRVSAIERRPPLPPNLLGAA